MPTDEPFYNKFMINVLDSGHLDQSRRSRTPVSRGRNSRDLERRREIDIHNTMDTFGAS